MTKKYQMTDFDASTLAVPEQVSVAMDEIAADLREGLLALAVGAGLQVMQQLMEADVAAACGPRGKHDPGPGGVSARQRAGFGHPGWSAGAGQPAPGPRRRRGRGGAGAGL